MFQFAVLVLNALVALPKIGAMVESFAAGCVFWYVSRANNATKSAINDATSQWAAAQTPVEIDAALDGMRAALSRPRLLS